MAVAESWTRKALQGKERQAHFVKTIIILVEKTVHAMPSFPRENGIFRFTRFSVVILFGCDKPVSVFSLTHSPRMSSDDGFPTCSSEEQHEVEMEVLRHFGRILNAPDFDAERSLVLNRESHIAFLVRGLSEPLKPSFISLEASRPWIAFWILHALDLLGQRSLILDKFSESVPAMLARCQHATGGFGGGPFQFPHLATSYAAVSALVCIGTESALALIDRVKMKRFLLSMKDPVTGGFRMHENGETDIRGTYCAIAVASLLQILDEDLTSGVAEYVQRCQTYEGGIAGEPGMEAHGGYNYCGLAALAIIGKPASDLIDSDALLAWISRRQMVFEGGFQGRANKLVDSCYTFWQGGALVLLAEMHASIHPPQVLFSPEPAQMYVLLACQAESGGLRDKPGKPADYYHSCYALSGLAALQFPTNELKENRVLGNPANQLKHNCVFYNNLVDRVLFAREFFSTQPDMGSEGLGVVSAYSRSSHFSLA